MYIVAHIRLHGMHVVGCRVCANCAYVLRLGELSHDLGNVFGPRRHCHDMALS